jgi:hypothetical protein
MSEPEKPTIDERLDALVQTGELLHLDVQTMAAKVDDLKAISDRHEKEIQRFRRAMRAALEAWLKEDGDQQ